MNQSKRKVAKAIAPEEATILQNIASMIQELLAGGGGAEEEVMMAMDEEEDDNFIQKEANGDQAANPNNKAENRVEEPTDITANNLSEVGKSLNTIIKMLSARTNKSAGGSNSVHKSAVNKSDNTNALVMKTLVEVTKAMKNMSTQQEQTNQAVANILDGLGVAESVKKSATVSNKPVVSMDSNLMANELMTVLKSLAQKEEQSTVGMNSFNVKKSAHAGLASILPQILQR